MIDPIEVVGKLQTDDVPRGALLVAEFNALRAEALNAKQNQQTVFQWSLAAMAAVFAAVVALKASSGATVVAFAVVIPIISVTGLMSWLGEVERMERAGRFIRSREAALRRDQQFPLGSEESYGTDAIVWESLLYDDRFRRSYGKNRLGSLAAVLLFFGSFLSSAAGAVVLSWSTTPGVGLAMLASVVLFVAVFVPRLRALQSSSSGRLPDVTRGTLRSPRTVALVVPCYNEEPALPWVLSRVPRSVQVIVSDDGSTDETAALARRAGVRVAPSERRRGVGAASRRGLLEADAEIVAIIDGDGSIDPSDLAALIAPIVAGQAVAVFGSRLHGGSAATWWTRLLVFAKRCLCRFSGQLPPVEDLGSAQAVLKGALSAEVLGSLTNGSAWSLDLALTLRSEHGAAAIVQVDLPFHPRIGSSKVSGSITGTVAAVIDVVRVLWRHRTDPRGPLRDGSEVHGPDGVAPHSA